MCKIKKIIFVILLIVPLFGCNSNEVPTQSQTEKMNEIISSFKKTTIEPKKLYHCDLIDIHFKEMLFENQQVVFLFEFINHQDDSISAGTLKTIGYSMFSINGYAMGKGFSTSVGDEPTVVDLRYNLSDLLEMNIDEIKFIDVQFEFSQREDDLRITDCYHLESSSQNQESNVFTDAFKQPIWKLKELDLFIQELNPNLKVANVELLSWTLAGQSYLENSMRNETLYLEFINHHDFDVLLTLPHFKLNDCIIENQMYEKKFLLARKKTIIEIPYSELLMFIQPVLGFEKVASIGFDLQVSTLENKELGVIKDIRIPIDNREVQFKTLDQPVFDKEGINIYLIGFTESEFTRGVLLVENKSGKDVVVEQTDINSLLNEYTTEFVFTPLSIPNGSKGIIELPIGMVRGHAFEPCSYKNIKSLGINLRVKTVDGKELINEMVKVK